MQESTTFKRATDNERYHKVKVMNAEIHVPSRV